MRRLLAVLISAGALVSLVAVADAKPRKRAVFKAPPAPVATASAPSFYAGLHGGYGWSQFSSPSPAETVRARGFLGGYQTGWNYQVGKVVVGSEFDFSLGSIQGNTSSTLGPTPITGGARHLWFSTLAGRFGFTQDRTLAYFKAGAALTRYKWQFDAPGVGNAFDAHTRLGWMLGLGVEQAISNNVSAKLEYNYMDFGTATEMLSTTGGLVAAPTSVRVYAHVVKLGMNYRFTSMR